MILAFHSTRFCLRSSCLSKSKILVATFSANAPEPNPKLSRIREPYIIYTKRGRKQPTIVIDPKTIPPCDQSQFQQKVDDNSNKTGAVANAKWKLGNLEIDPSKLHKYCLMLSKFRLTSLVVITAMGGYALAPGPFDLWTFVACSVGTGLVSAAANAVNQSMEVPFDAQMSRTKNRILVRGLLAPEHAVAFAAISGIAGVSLLAYQVNTLTALLGGANLVLYTSIYTPLKRLSILNTWVGSIVGAVPPLMGWAGCVGSIANPGAWIMSGMLYAWQFPHFNALSWNLRPDYSKAGYRMMALTNPGLCRRTSFRYTAVLMALSYLAPALDVTHWWFAVASTPLNAYFLYLAWEFRKHGDARTSRRLFRFSLLHLPILMTLMLLSKKYWFLNSDKKSNNQPQDVEKRRQLLEAIARLTEQTSA